VAIKAAVIELIPLSVLTPSRSSRLIPSHFISAPCFSVITAFITIIALGRRGIGNHAIASDPHDAITGKSRANPAKAH